ncbi:unnamed protein product, partial [Ectocarpus sp. 12 AP-2014]
EALSVNGRAPRGGYTTPSSLRATPLERTHRQVLMVYRSTFSVPLAYCNRGKLELDREQVPGRHSWRV